MTDLPHRGMKAKTIKAILAKKFKSFADTIEDEAVRKMVQNNTIITGGCIASMLLGEKINDFDLYFTDHATTKAVAEYYVKRFEVKNRAGIPCPIFVEDIDGRVKVVIKSAGVASNAGAVSEYQYFEGGPDEAGSQYVAEVMGSAGEVEERYQETEALALDNDEDGYKPVFMSTNAITLSGKIQIVLRFYGAADQIHENYDFVHCTNYWLSKDGSLTLRQPALESLLCKELRYVGSKYPVCSVIRLRKFIRRGWVINAGQILKMMMQISELDLTQPDVLQDQLTGVDSAYFHRAYEQGEGERSREGQYGLSRRNHRSDVLMNKPAKIGHNNPPEPSPFEAMELHILNLFETAQGFLDGEPIANEAQAALVNKLISDALEARRDAEAMRKEEAKPFDDGKAAVQAKWTPYTDEKKGKCTLIVSTARKALQPWLLRLEEEQNARAEAARQEAEKARLALLEVERAARASDDLEAAERVAQTRKEADITNAIANRAEKAKPLAKGSGRATGLRSVWSGKITDRKATLIHYCQARPADLEAWLQGEVDSDVRTGARVIPGVEITEERVAI